jgi:hypothetical protein
MFAAPADIIVPLQQRRFRAKKSMIPIFSQQQDDWF